MGCSHSHCRAYYQAYDSYLKSVHAENERYISAISSGSRPKNDEFSFVPAVLSVGGIRYTDRYGHGYLQAIPQANGELRYDGTEFATARLLGRAELDRVGPKWRDGRFSND